MSSNTASTLVLVHGLHSSPMEFVLIERLLDAHGIAFDALEIPGYTAGLGPRSDDGTAWVTAAESVLDSTYGPGAPIHLAGLSAGGAIAATLASRRRRQDVRGLALLSPVFAFDGWSIGSASRYRGLLRRLGLDQRLTVAEREPFGIKNERMRARVRTMIGAHDVRGFGPMRLSLRAVGEVESLFANAASQFASLDAPLLLVHAREDEVASLASARRGIARARRSEVVVLDDSYHMITLDNDRSRVASALASWVRTDRAVADARAALREESIDELV